MSRRRGDTEGAPRLRPDLEAALRATHEVAQAMRARMKMLRRACEGGDVAEIVRWARIVVGLDEEEELRRKRR